MEECMHTCSKLNRARAPPSSNLKELEEARQLHVKFCKIPNITYGAVWLAITDAEEEGEWRDYYSGQQVSQEVLGEAGGGLEGGSTHNCGIVS